MLSSLYIFAQACQPKGSLFGLPTWYKYLRGTSVDNGAGGTICQPQLQGINDIWLVGAALIDLLVRAAAIIAIGFIVVGGVRYITSLGEPDKTARARQTIINALIGLAIAIVASVGLSYIAGRF